MIKIVPKVWGEERWIVNNDQYCGKLLILNKGWSCSLHYHPVKHETFYILTGLVRLELGQRTLWMEPGDTATIPPGTQHRFTGIRHSQIMEFSTKHDDADVVRIEESKFDREVAAYPGDP